MAAYLNNEGIYSKLVREFIAREINADIFVKKFMSQWKVDRDHQWSEIENNKNLSKEEKELCEILDQIFTACDCYDPEPKEKHEIGKAQLLAEVSQLTSKRWKIE